MFTLSVDDEIQLRLPDVHHVDLRYALIAENRDFIGQYMDWAQHQLSSQNLYDRVLVERRLFADREELGAVIYYQDMPVGKVGIRVLDASLRLADVGYWLGKAYTGKGIATRAARAMVDYGFGQLNMHKITIRAMTTNEASLAIPKRLGFHYEGRRVHEKLHYGEFYDFDVHYVLEDDWEQTLPSLEFSYQVDDKLELRLFEPHHAETLFALTNANRAHLREWLPWVDATAAVDDTMAFIERGLEQFGSHDGMQIGIWYDGELCGACGYHYWDFTNKSAEIGYWLDQSHTGKGIMTRCVRALIDYAFDVLDLHRIEIRCATGNTRSCAIPERLGFTHEGVLRQAEKLYERIVDSNVYALLAPDWQQGG